MLTQQNTLPGDRNVSSTTETLLQQEYAANFRRRHHVVAPTYEERMSWKIRWFFAITFAIGYITSMVTGVIGFSISRNPYFLTFLSPTLFIPLVYYLVPIDEKRYQLKLLIIQMRREEKSRKEKASS